MNQHQTTASELVYAFYEARKAKDPDALRRLIADDVSWKEPEVGEHMGHLTGVDAVVDMLKRAYSTTEGTFQLRVASTLELGNLCAAIIEWSAVKQGELVSGRELAVFRFNAGQIAEASFFAGDISDDQAFWSE